MYPTFTLKETFEMLGLHPDYEPVCKKIAKYILPDSTGEPDWRYARVDVRKRESGVPELVISIPFGIKGL